MYRLQNVNDILERILYIVSVARGKKVVQKSSDGVNIELVKHEKSTTKVSARVKVKVMEKCSSRQTVSLTRVNSFSGV